MADYVVNRSVSQILNDLKDADPDNAVWTGAIDGLKTTANGLGLGGVTIPIVVPQAIIDDIIDFVTPDADGGGGSTPVPGLDLAAVDPLEPLKKIAQAINEAEGLLNQENLVIATGEVEATLNVDVGGVAGANAAIRITIQPRPES